jgi:hypothetical protein
MVEAEILIDKKILFLRGKIITYGNAATAELTKEIADEIETLWNEPNGVVLYNRTPFTVIFSINHFCDPELDAGIVIRNLDPQSNFYRIENNASGNISFVDGLGSNTGYFLLENLYKGSTTAAHEFGHGLGLDHPRDMDFRGRGRPGIMYPRGTLVDPEFQYDSTVAPGLRGGTMHPMYRRVRKEDINLLRLDRLRFKNNKAIVGGFTNVYHQPH